MPEIAQQCNRKSNIFNDMRAIVGMDLTRNEMKVLTVYRIEMDEATRQVRNKSQEDLRALTGLGRSQFSEASGCLQRRGLITVKRARNAPQLITVSDLVSEHQEVRETRMSGNPVIRDSGSPEIPDSGSPGNPGDDIFTAPVTTPVSSPRRASADDGPMPSNVIPVTDWRTAFARTDEPQVTIARDGTITLDAGLTDRWLKRFGTPERLALALEAVRLQRNSSEPLWQQVNRQLARIAADKLDRDERYTAAVKAKGQQPASGDVLGFKLTTAVHVKPKLEPEVCTRA